MLPVSSDPAGWQAEFSTDPIECVPFGTTAPSPENDSLYSALDTKSRDPINLATHIRADEVSYRDRQIPPQPVISRVKSRSVISERKRPMLEAAKRVIHDLRPYWPLSVRQIHYRLLNDPPLRNSVSGKQRARYRNDRASYQDLRKLLIRARLLNEVPWESVTNQVRLFSGTFNDMDAARFTALGGRGSFKEDHQELLQRQSDHVELVVEKPSVRGILEPVANDYRMPMTVGREHCSIESRYDIVRRFRQSRKDRLVLLIASDFDPDGNLMAGALARSLRDDFGVRDVVARKILLRKDQVLEWDLSPNELRAKPGRPRYDSFVSRYGSNAVYELEAIPPGKMQAVVQEAIEACVDIDDFIEQLEEKASDAVELRSTRGRVTEMMDDFDF